MADFKLIGQNYTTPDLVAKVTGRAKYAEDFRAEGMVFCKLLLSPFPHARVTGIDASEALAMPGVEGILTADDLPPQENRYDERPLTNEPVYEGEPILALAAVDETTAAEAIERVRVSYEPLPFVVDPLESLRPGSPNGREDGNAYVGRDITTIKWPAEVFDQAAEGTLPMGEELGEQWAFGDVDAALAAADLVYDETVVIQSTSHQPLETRSAMAYWQNGKLYLHGSTQSVVRTLQTIANSCGITPEEVVLIGEYCGGGFGSKIPGSIQMAIPALLSRKINKPVMMRVTRMEENYFGKARAGFQARTKIGFRRDGRITALDMFIVQDNGPYNRQGDFLSAGRCASLGYQPENMRFRGVSVITNTPPRTSQRAPGGLQYVMMLEPYLARAAKELGVDQAELHKINAPEGQAAYGPPDPEQRRVTSAFVKEAIDLGVEKFRWQERRARSGQRNGTKVTGVGMAVSTFVGGSSGFDGLLVIRPDGVVQIQSGIGNLGTHSVFDMPRAALEALDTPFEQAEIVWGNTAKHLPWTCVSAGSQTTHAMSRANWAAGLDAKRKLQEIAATDLGGSPDDYQVSNGRVFRAGNTGRGLTFAQAAERAIALGGRYDGHELPADINAMTTASAQALAGQGLMGVAKDNFPIEGDLYSYVAAFAEVQVDVETGHYELIDYLPVTDCGIVVNPRGLAAQIHGGGIQGIGGVRSQKWVYDQQWGLPVAKRFYHNKPPTILDVPIAQEMDWGAVNLPDPQTPIGARGIGEPPIGAGAGALLAAIVDAVGDAYLRRMPVTPDNILTAIESVPAGAAGAISAHV